MTVLALVSIIGIAGMAVASIAWVIPGANSSRLQIDLRAIRDDVEDEIECDFYSDPVVAARLRDLIDAFSDNVRELSVARVFMMYVFSSQSIRREVRAAEWWPNPERLPAGEQERLEDHLDEFMHSVVHHLFTGTPSGWIAVGLIRIVSLLKSRGRERRIDETLVSEEAVGLVLHCAT